ncbi:sensor histidine kinase [Clostridium oryzae]|uniref:histidine kinase n=1 Tax=Clostridium oryzae TaxID=1450648 RepID=A0A1V4IMG6_9CLOT|nr:HAMP domain-containing sensor histidine kinase [Clostridium oryzae]OPJ61083.1 signal transduction histidine-protein kinase BaeS [Clostridium oryzae]
MQSRSLKTKTVTVFIIILYCVSFTFAFLLSIWFNHYYFVSRKKQYDMQAKVLVKRYVKTLKNDNYDSRKRLHDDTILVGSYVDADVFITDNMGYVSTESNPKFKNIEFQNFMAPDIEELRQGQSIEKKGAYKDVFKEDMYIYMRPAMDNGMFKGAVAIFTPISQMRLELAKIYSLIWSLAVLIGMAGSYLMYYFTKKIITGPLDEINKAATKISKGEVERRVYLKCNNEINELAEAFNSMADSLEKVEKNRREFISNVSHELRSPITSIKGFIGGILDGVIPRDKENYYLSITYEEIQRLTRLVNDLLDLSAMEAGKFTLSITEVDVNEIIRLCVIKFETRINEKKLKVDVVLEDEHLYVFGDRDRLIQIVTNILDNAVKYVNEGGNIKISTRTRSDKVLVSIFNDGPQIPDEDLKNIWERFYKSDKSRTSKQSTGLGLPIIRNILTQLGQDIWVENGKKYGVTFYFTLKKV